MDMFGCTFNESVHLRLQETEGEMDSIAALNVQELRSQFRLQRQQVRTCLNLLCLLYGSYSLCLLYGNNLLRLLCGNFLLSSLWDSLKLFNVDDMYYPQHIFTAVKCRRIIQLSTSLFYSVDFHIPGRFSDGKA